MPKFGSIAKCRARPAAPARGRSRASICPIAWCSPIPWRRATNSKSQSSRSTGRFRPHRQTSSGFAKRRSSSFANRVSLNGWQKERLRRGVARPKTRVELVGGPCYVIEQGCGVDGRELDRTHRRERLLHARTPQTDVPHRWHDAAEDSAAEQVHRLG